MVVLLAAANRDPEHFPDPDLLDLDRSGGQHLSFGAGAHYCLGATFGRLQAGIALGTFLRRVADPVVAAEPPDRPVSLGGLTSLPITFREVSPAAT
jgi:cytochrome P450